MVQTEWGWLIAISLFLGGLGAGSFLVASILEWSGIRYKYEFCPETLVGAGISGLVVGLDSLLLIFDLEAGKTQPWRILWMFINSSSVMTWGVRILSIFIPLGLLYGVVELLSQMPSWEAFLRRRFTWFKAGWREIKRPLTIVGSVFALATALYTGVLISAVGPAIPFWSAPIFPGLPIPLLPMLFLVSAILIGMSFVFELAGTIAPSEIVHRYTLPSVIFLILIGLKAILIGLYLLSASSLGGAGSFAVRMIISGPLSVSFWTFVVFLGLLLPFITHAYAIGTRHLSPVWHIISGMGIILAGFFLRYIVLLAGVRAFL
ncbi:MAG: NrfD/PsrC family molybdoenzyme membrane anchor subunit [Anaerolineae bacterium]|nr:NrfD/PsrC family molybdoenzyme membrane anchor subunit [Anaerolineae bacterium]